MLRWVRHLRRHQVRPLLISSKQILRRIRISRYPTKHSHLLLPANSSSNRNRNRNLNSKPSSSLLRLKTNRHNKECQVLSSPLNRCLSRHSSSSSNGNSSQTQSGNPKVTQ